MECTQRLECTQELCESQLERSSLDEIGFLGICGAKYVVKKGPNKIGRDPQTCNIVLNLNSISRQHAVINILNKNEFMLMDLDSANKTKLENKTLMAYIPHPLKNGDTVQFGQVFGVFRLFEDECDLPMTQAIEVPETPVQTKHISKLNHAAVTTVPESPDVSDREESFIVSSQANDKNKFKSPNNNFIKSSGRTIAIQPVGSKKIDNVFWSSSKKSDSFNSQLNSSETLDDSVISVKSAETVLAENKIHEMNTQMPGVNTSNDSIYDANTQIPNNLEKSQTIYNSETQITPDHLPEVCKIQNQHEMQFNLFAANKENDTSIFNAETQNLVPKNKESIESKAGGDSNNTSNKENTSDDDILFDDIDHEDFEDNFESQNILLPLLPHLDFVSPQSSIQHAEKNNVIELESKTCNRNRRLNSDSSTDCEDSSNVLTQDMIAKTRDDDLTDCEEDLFDVQTQKIEVLSKQTEKAVDEDVTDCEDDVFEENKNISSKTTIDRKHDDDVTDCKDDEDAVKTSNVGKAGSFSAETKNVNFEDLQTQIIDDVLSPNVCPDEKNVIFEDLPTQVIVEEEAKSEECVEDALTQKIPENIQNSPFKIPLQSPIKVKRKDILKTKPVKIQKEIIVLDDEDDKYYASTQEVHDDLCTQVTFSPDTILTTHKIGQKMNIVKYSPLNRSSESSEGEDKVNKFVSNLSNSQIREVIGIDIDVAPLKKAPSDGSDIEITPKKTRMGFMDIELPNSQEIKTSVSITSRTLVTESSSESETEQDSEQCTPILFKKKKRKKSNDVKLDLTKKFDAESLPTRIITRVRKPTSKIQDSDEPSKKNTKNILKSKYLTEQEDNINNDIISENISRLRNKNGKPKNENGQCTESKKHVDKIKENEIEKVKNVNNENNQGYQLLHKSHKNISRVKNDDIYTDGLKDKKKDEESEKNNDKNKFKEPHNSHKIDKHTAEKHTKSKESQNHISKESKERRSRKNKSVKAESSETSNQSMVSNISTDPHLTKEPRSMRSSRRRKLEENKNDKRSISPEKERINDEKKETRQQNNKRKEKVESSPEKELEVRRSKRQKTNKKDNESIIKVKIKSRHSNSKRNKDSNHEQSTVYNISAESGVDSPQGVKRPASYDIGREDAKKTRSANVNNLSLRATPARTNRTQHVLFTAFPCEEVKVKLEKLGAVIVSDVKACTVVLTLQIKRTFKLLCAVGLGRPIVGPNWVQACADTNMIVDPWLYLIKDEATEKRFQFNLERSLVSKRNFLRGYTVSSTPSVMPNAAEMKLIVECSGGQWREGGSQWICVSSPMDKNLWTGLKKRGATIVSTEFILGGVLKQTLEIDKNKLA